MKTLADKHDDEILLRCLDGELSQAEREAFVATLSASERTELLATENAMQVLEQLPQITAPASLVLNVMAAIAPNKKRPVLSQLRGWLEQHPLLGWEVSGMALVASLLFMTLAPTGFLLFQSAPPGQSPFIQAASMSGAAQAERVKFSLYAPQAHSINLIGDFNGWGSERQLSLHPQGNGIWTVEVSLPPGRYQYALLIDGKNMVTDPRAEQHVSDDFGRKNAVITVM